MGTRFEIVLVPGRAACSERSRTAGEAAIDEIQEWHRRLTRFEPDSFVSHLNRTAWQTPVQLDEEMFALFADALAVSHDSSGAFDIAMTPGSRHVVLDAETRTIRFDTGPVSLDLGAIGKGHALDCAAALLRRLGVERAFLHGGTSSGVAIGDAGNGEPWRMALGSSDGPVIPLRDQAFSVSDTHSQVDASGAGHIRDPREAGPASKLTRTCVAVVGPSARLADAWSTALAVVGAVPPAFPPAYTAHWI